MRLVAPRGCLTEHDAAKTLVVLGYAQKEAHRSREQDTVPQEIVQSLRNLGTDVYNSAHFAPQLFLASLKSGAHPSKVLPSVNLGWYHVHFLTM